MGEVGVDLEGMIGIERLDELRRHLAERQRHQGVAVAVALECRRLQIGRVVLK